MEIDNLDINELDIAYEKILLYQQFKRNVMTYRLNHLDRVIKFTPDIELPKDSVLHMIDNLDRSFSPILNIDYPFINNSSRRLFVQSISSLLDTKEFKYIHNPNIHKRELMHFYNSEDRIVRALNYKQYISNRSNMIIFNYNPLVSVKMKEAKLRNYKKFEIIFRTIIKDINEIHKFNSDKIHFLPIFFKNKHINRQRYLKALDRIDNISIKKTDTYDFFFILHILKFIEKHEDSIFAECTYDLLHKLHFVLNIKK